MLNQLLLASIKFARSMIAMIKMPHTNHQMSSSSPSKYVELIVWKKFTDRKLATKVPVEIPTDAFAGREFFKIFLHVP